MIDLHSHILHGIDDGANSLEISLAMARAYVDDGVAVVACTPHILPGLYNNSGPAIRSAVAQLQFALTLADIPLNLVTGADNHLTPTMVRDLRTGHLLSLADTRYVLIEPPHHVVPPRMDETFFALVTAGFVPILTHPERMTWISQHYAAVKNLAQSGVWMQLTAASIVGMFGKTALYWSERMLDDGLAHIIATDSHDIVTRKPCLKLARDRVLKRVGEFEAENLVSKRPRGILDNVAPHELPLPPGSSAMQQVDERSKASDSSHIGFAGRVLRIFG